MENWNWEVINCEVYIVDSNGKKIAKMLQEDVTQEEMIDNASLIKINVNDYFKLKEAVKH